MLARPESYRLNLPVSVSTMRLKDYAAHGTGDTALLGDKSRLIRVEDM